MTRLLSTPLLVLVLGPTVVAASGEDEQYLQVGRTCVEAREPDVCMASYGFECSIGRTPCESRLAQLLSCNLDLGDGRAHFVQMTYDGNNWGIDLEKTYVLEYEAPRIPEENPDVALSGYLRQQMDGYSGYDSGSGTDGHGVHTGLEIGVRRQGVDLQMRALCGFTYAEMPDESVSARWRSDCERRLYRMIKSLSQSDPAGPYRVAGPSEIEWQTHSATLVSGHNALILDGRYSFPEGHRPCRDISDCCSEDGALYLQSCRTPTETELKAIDQCLEAGHGRGSDDFVGCLRAAGVKAGCQVQDDGSYLCY